MWQGRDWHHGGRMRHLLQGSALMLHGPHSLSVWKYGADGTCRRWEPGREASGVTWGCGELQALGHDAQAGERGVPVHE